MKKSSIHYADWDEMVFAQKEQAFGAYVLRKSYPRHLMVSLLAGSILFLSVTLGPLLWNKVFGKEIETETRVDVVNILTPPPLIDEKPEVEIVPPPPPPEAPKPKLTKAFQIPEPSPEPLEDTTTINSIEELKKAPNIGTAEIEGEDEEVLFEPGFGDDDIPDVIRETLEPSPTVFIDADHEPEPINMKQIGVVYPQTARDAGIEGTVVVRILVDNRGNYKKHLVINAVHPLLTKAVEDKVSKLKFTPAIQGNRAIPFWVNIPFTFTLID